MLSFQYPHAKIQWDWALHPVHVAGQWANNEVYSYLKDLFLLLQVQDVISLWLHQTQAQNRNCWINSCLFFLCCFPVYWRVCEFRNTNHILFYSGTEFTSSGLLGDFFQYFSYDLRSVVICFILKINAHDNIRILSLMVTSNQIVYNLTGFYSLTLLSCWCTVCDGKYGHPRL